MALDSNFDVSEMFAARESQRSALHTRYLNEQFVRVLKTIGYDVGFQKGQGQYLYDRAGDKYLDLLSGFGVFAIGRNHPALRQALQSVLDADLPNLVQFDVSALAGILAERLLEHVPYLDKVFFANSGAETVEAAIKFARGATGRPGIVYCSHAFHGLSYGALSLTDDPNFRLGFEPLLPKLTRISDENKNLCRKMGFIVHQLLEYFSDISVLFCINDGRSGSRQSAVVAGPIRPDRTFCLAPAPRNRTPAMAD